MTKRGAKARQERLTKLVEGEGGIYAMAADLAKDLAVLTREEFFTLVRNAYEQLAMRREKARESEEKQKRNESQLDDLRLKLEAERGRTQKLSEDISAADALIRQRSLTHRAMIELYEGLLRQTMRSAEEVVERTLAQASPR